jgi:D-3-phosphoglycerate dehydrogenase / 2-oxoglutarate reductase
MMKTYITAAFSPKELQSLQAQVDIVSGGWGFTGKKLKQHELISWAHDAEILIVGYEEVTQEVVSSLPRLRLVACARGGYSANIDVEALNKRRIPLIYTPGRNASAVADLAMGLLLATCRNIARTSCLIASKLWQNVSWDIAGETECKRFSGPEMEGKNLGIIGFGAVGRKVAQRAGGFGLNILVYDPYVNSKEQIGFGVEFVALEMLLRQVDFLVICAKLTQDTVNLLSMPEFEMMKPGAYIVNVARGAIINEEDLVAALQENKIAGVGLDVLVEEPIRHNHPLLDMPNVVLTPHIGGASDDLTLRQSIMLGKDISLWLDGKNPVNLANPEVL